MTTTSLKDTAIRAAKKNIKELTDFGDLPYALMAPILDAVLDPTHLLLLQTNTPQLAKHTAEKWEAFISRDVPSWSRHQVYPSTPELWWQVYRDEKQRADEEAFSKLRDAYADHAAKRVDQRIQYVPDLILPSTTKSRANKKVPARSAIMSKVLKEAARARTQRDVPKSKSRPPPQKHIGLAPVYARKVKELSDAYHEKKGKEFGESREREKQAIVAKYHDKTRQVLEYDPLGLWGPPTTASEPPQPSPDPLPRSPVEQASKRLSATPSRHMHELPASPIARPSAVDVPATPTVEVPVRISKRSPASITRGAKRTRFF